MSATLPLPMQLVAAALAVWLLWRSARTLPWYKMEGDAEARRVLVVAALLVIGLRLFNTHGLAGVTLHFLGSSILVLMFGAGFALWVTAAASLATWLLGWAWNGWAMDFLVTGALPVATTLGVGLFARRMLPPHPMVYVLGNAAAAGAVAIASSVLAKALLSWALGAEKDAGLYLLATPPMMIGEAFFTGGVMVLIVVYRPQWCSSFDDGVYLRAGRDA